MGNIDKTIKIGRIIKGLIPTEDSSLHNINTETNESIIPKDIGEPDTNTTIIYNPDIKYEGGFAMSYI